MPFTQAPFSTSAFLEVVTKIRQQSNPWSVLQGALQDALDVEAQMRSIFATDPEDPRVEDPFVGLVDIYAHGQPTFPWTTCARTVSSDEDLKKSFIMPLSPERRRSSGTPAMAPTFQAFWKRLLVFTEGSLRFLTDQRNMVIGGGAINACVTALPDGVDETETSLRRYYHSSSSRYPSSDIDIFLYGLDKDAAIRKIRYIFKAVKKAIPVATTYIFSSNVITIYSQFPFRPIQIITKLYHSPAEILLGFDVDASAFLLDGNSNRVYGLPRAIVAMMRQANTLDMSRLTPSYELRLGKYGEREYETFFDGLNREMVDPLLYTSTLSDTTGLRRLLLLENMLLSGIHIWTLEGRYSKTKYVLTSSNYAHVLGPSIPYGPGWTAEAITAWFKAKFEADAQASSQRRITTNLQTAWDTLVFEPSTNNPPILPLVHRFDPRELSLWTRTAYVPDAVNFFMAIASHDSNLVGKFIKQETFDLNQRNAHGQTGLHLAILLKAEGVAHQLLDAPRVDITLCLEDGRNALHLAAQLGMAVIARRLTQANGNGDYEQERDPILDVNQRAAEGGYTPLTYALLSASYDTIEVLVGAGASVSLVSYGPKTGLYDASTFTLYSRDMPEELCEVLGGGTLIIDIHRNLSHYF